MQRNTKFGGFLFVCLFLVVLWFGLVFWGGWVFLTAAAGFD